MTMHRGKDRSKKGSLDAPIVDLVRGFNSRHDAASLCACVILTSFHLQVGLINGHQDYVTTSSCSGRIALFEDVDGSVCRKVR